jgi:hypothetical protein
VGSARFRAGPRRSRISIRRCHGVGRDGLTTALRQWRGRVTEPGLDTQMRIPRFLAEHMTRLETPAEGTRPGAPEGTPPDRQDTPEGTQLPQQDQLDAPAGTQPAQ